MEKIKSKIDELEKALESENSNSVQKIIFDLGLERNEKDNVLDEVVTSLLNILRRPEMHESSLSGHILNFFEFEENSLSDKQRNYLIGFLNAWGNSFAHVHSMQVVYELSARNNK